MIAFEAWARRGGSLDSTHKAVPHFLHLMLDSCLLFIMFQQ